jgi:hypothetical protein
MTLQNLSIGIHVGTTGGINGSIMCGFGYSMSALTLTINNLTYTNSPMNIGTNSGRYTQVSGLFWSISSSTIVVSNLTQSWTSS